ncbi:rhomboid family intramembrane serine protease [Nocardioides sp. NBC_00850]|uniref:rhomboid family intramembrane serine protease n=1 Tax=Nocardioides sp. NBC_00850 TaxID=2976001 RepID=UPI00386CCAE2|nr:rhomboid family intramembrane serine protease [Nocardioides sp. NBC_00850]
MTPASVGFQCPECLREGHKSVRQPKRFTGARVGFRALPVTFSLIGANVLVWLSIILTGGSGSRIADFIAIRLQGYCLTPDGGFAVPNDVCRASGYTWMPGVDDGAVWQVLTSMFTHVSIIHLAVNMLSLYMLGSFLEPIVGRLRFLVFYLISGLAGSALVVWASAPAGSTVGASGAIFGLLGVLVVLFVRAGQSLAPLLPVLLINAGITFFGNGISWQGHVGGFVGGLVVAWIYTSLRADRKAPLQWAALGAFTLALLALIGVRILVF